MKRTLTGLALALGVLLLSVSALAAYIVLVLDPNDYKAELAAVVAKKTDMTLDIQGRLAWQLYPNVGIKLGATTFTDPASRERLAAIDQAAVSVKLLPLLSGKVSINAILLDAAALRLVRYPDGTTSWDRLLAKLKSPDEEEPSKQVDFAIEALTVRNTQLALVDRQSGVTRVVDRIAVQAKGIDLKQAFPVALDFRFAQRDATGKTVTAVNHVETVVKADMTAQTHQLTDLLVTSQLSGSLLPAPVALTLKAADITADVKTGRHAVQQLALDVDYRAKQPIKAALRSDVRVDVPAGQATLDGLTLEATLPVGEGNLPVTFRGGVAANWKTGVISLPALAATAAGMTLDGRLMLKLPAIASGAQPITSGMTLSGNLRTNTFSPRALMATLGLKAPVTRRADVLGAASLRTDLTGTGSEVLTRNLVIRLDGSTLTGEAGVRELPAARLFARLALDRINVDDYLPPKTETAAAATTPEKTAKAVGGLLPVGLLRSQNLDVGLQVGHLDAMSYSIDDLRLAASARGGLVDVSDFSGRIGEGRFSVPVTIDVRGAQPVIALRPDIRQIDLGPIAKQALKRDLFAGRMNFTGNVRVTGNDADAWIRSAQGPNTLTLDGGQIKGINITDALFEALGQYQVLLPLLTGRDNAALKNKIQNTDIVALLGEVTLNQGVVNNQAMKVDLRDVQVGGNGTFNLVTQDVDYRFQLKLDKKYWGEKNAKFADYPIPVHCNGNLKGSLVTLCGIDKAGMQGILAQIAQARMSQELDKQKAKLTDKLDQKLADKLPPQQKEAVKQLFDAFLKR